MSGEQTRSPHDSIWSVPCVAEELRNNTLAQVVNVDQYADAVPVLRVFAAAREAVGSSTVVVEGETVAQVLDNAIAQFGDAFADVLAQSKVWVNGEEVPRSRAVSDNDEVAVLPPVSGGA